MFNNLIKSALSTVLLSLFIIGPGYAANAININAPLWLGNLKLPKTQLQAIKKSVEKAMTSAIDAEQQCGDVYLDCIVRAAREWKVKNTKYREIVIHIHTVGHTSRSVSQTNGQWPKVVFN